MEEVMRKVEVKPSRLQIEELEQRIASSVTGTGGFDGQPGNQSSAKHNPSGSSNPEKTSSKIVRRAEREDSPEKTTRTWREQWK